MTSISNIPIGRKIALVLGGTVFLLAGLSALSLWGIRTGERLTEDTIARLSQAQLAAEIASEQANISIDFGKMVLAREASDALVDDPRHRDRTIHSWGEHARIRETRRGNGRDYR